MKIKQALIRDLYVKSAYKKLLIALVWVFCVSSIFASSEKIGTTAMDFMKLESSVKGEALGNAITAGSEISAIGVNPASIARIERTEFNMQYLYYYQDISYKSLRVAVPTELGSFGFSAGLIDLGIQERTTFLDRDGSSSDTFRNHGYQLIGAYAHNFGDIDAGISFRYLSETLDSNSGKAVGLDLGLQAILSDDLTLGVAWNGMTLSKAKYIEEDAELAESVRIGLRYMAGVVDKNLAFNFDLVSPEDGDIYYGVGVEYLVNSMLYLRGGYSSYSELSDVSLGVGLVLGDILIDFTYKPSKLFGQSYRVGFGMKL
jgi:hypothetical protein